MSDDESVSVQGAETSVLRPFIGNKATDEGASVRLIRRPTDTPESGIPDTVHVLTMDAISQDPLLTTEALAEHLSVPPRTLEDWRRMRTGPPYVRLGRKLVRYRMSDVVAYLDAQVVRGDEAA
ncbi:MAG: helix-turn-helix transcriptional regulator [Microbacterium gubbeenense]|uniref:helix-turn-helix transcriptional regulator n=2 Tax=Microbacterium gubbeenense TaxID=159896 RepID=UPI003F9B60A3